MALNFEVARDDLRKHRVTDRGEPELRQGEVQLRIDQFGLTANNVTYAAFGDLMSYWRFFPAEPGWGRIPVWGHADVEVSTVEGVGEGERYFGYFPMSTHLVVRAGRVKPGGFVDEAEHRSSLPSVYNRYQRVPAPGGPGGPADHDRSSEQLRTLFQFTTSFLIDDWLADESMFGAKSVVLSSASSKTAIGLAHLLSTNRQVEVVGLTSAGNADFVRGLGCYDRTIEYSEVAELPAHVPTVFVDLSGDGDVQSRVHRHFGDSLKFSSQVGATHWEEMTRHADLPGPAPSLFFAPDHVVRRNKDWGADGLQQRVDEALADFLVSVKPWLQVVERRGPDEVAATWLEVLEGRTRPDQGFVLSLFG